MRPIKFRFWHRIRKEFIEGVIMNEGNIYESYRDFEDGIISLDVEIIQFTGLLDKNGKEIYEGDIVKWENDEDMFGNIEKGEGFVKFHPEYVRFDISLISEAKSEFRGTTELLSRLKGCEVIGNIYQNPELSK